MPKGKILMGKKAPEPTPTQVNVPKRNPRQPIGGPGVGKPKPVKPRPKGMPPVYGNSNYKPKPTPKSKVFEGKLDDTKQKKNETVTVYSKYAPLSNKPGKTKPVMPRRGGK